MRDAVEFPVPVDASGEDAPTQQIDEASEAPAPGELLTPLQLVILRRAHALGGSLKIRRVSRGPSTASDLLFEAARCAPHEVLDPSFAPGWDIPGAPTQEVRLARLGELLSHRMHVADESAAHAGARELGRRALDRRVELACGASTGRTALDEALLHADLDGQGAEAALRHNLTVLLGLLSRVEQHNALVRVARIVRDYDDRRPERELGRYLKFLARGRNAGHAAEMVVDALVNEHSTRILAPSLELSPPSISDDLDGKVDHWLRVRGESSGLPLAALDTKIGATKGSTLMAESRTHLHDDEDMHVYGRNVLRIDARVSERFIASWILHALHGAPFSPEACYATCYAELCDEGVRGKHLIPYEVFCERTQLAIGLAIRREIQHLLSQPPPQ